MLLLLLMMVPAPPTEGLVAGPVLGPPPWDVVAKEVEELAVAEAEPAAAAAPQPSSLLLQLLLDRRFCLE